MSPESKNSGSTLIEILVVAFILTTSLVALVSLTVMSTARNRLAKERSVATRLAQEGMDWVMSERNRVGVGGIALIAGTYCMGDLSNANINGLPMNCSNDSPPMENYQRELHIDAATNEVIDYHVRVFWGDQAKPYEVILTGRISKWKR